MAATDKIAFEKTTIGKFKRVGQARAGHECHCARDAKREYLFHCDWSSGKLCKQLLNGSFNDRVRIFPNRISDTLGRRAFPDEHVP